MHSEVTTFKKQCVLGSRGLQPPPFSPRLNKRRSKIHFVGMHTKECEKSTEDKLDFCVWAQRRNPSDTQPSKGTDCWVLNSHHLSRAFPWAPCVYACAAPNFLFPPSCSVIHHQRSRLCALPGNTIATGKVSPRRPPAFLSHIHSWPGSTCSFSALCSPSAAPYPSAPPSLSLHYLGNRVALRGYSWPAARLCTGTGSSSSVQTRQWFFKITPWSCGCTCTAQTPPTHSPIWPHQEDLPIPVKCCGFCYENLNGRFH